MTSNVASARLVRALVAGAAGAAALTAVHQLGQRVFADAPRMDVVGMRAMAGVRRRAGLSIPDRDTLYRQTLAGDLVFNTLYYSLVAVASPHRRWARGSALGLAAGLGALVLPRPLGLGEPPRSESRRNQLLTVAWYTTGGLTAAATLGVVSRRRDPEPSRNYTSSDASGPPGQSSRGTRR